MKNSGIAIALIIAVVSSAALAAPKTYDSALDQPGRYFNCLIPHQGGVREGPCWLG